MAVAAETGTYSVINPMVLAPIIALGIVVPVVIDAVSGGFRSYIEAWAGLKSPPQQ